MRIFAAILCFLTLLLAWFYSVIIPFALGVISTAILSIFGMTAHESNPSFWDSLPFNPLICGVIFLVGLIALPIMIFLFLNAMHREYRNCIKLGVISVALNLVIFSFYFVFLHAMNTSLFGVEGVPLYVFPLLLIATCGCLALLGFITLPGETHLAEQDAAANP